MQRRPVVSVGVLLVALVAAPLTVGGFVVWRAWRVHDLATRAMEQVEDDDKEGALLSAQKAVRLAPRSAAAWATMGSVRGSRKEWEAAEAAFRRALALEPGEPRLLEGLGWCLWVSGRESEAMSLYEQALRLNPHDSYALVSLGVIYDNGGDPGKAAECYRKAIEPGSDPDYAADAHNMLGYWYAQRREWLRALAEIDTALLLEPDSAVLLDSKGAIATLSGDLKTGEEALRRAIAAPDAEDCSRATLAYCLARQSRDDEARRELAAVADGLALQGPDMDTSSLYFAARAYAELGESDRAAELAEAFVRRWPKHPWAADMRKLVPKAPPDRPDPKK